MAAKDSLVRVLETQVNESETSSYEVGEQRERNHRYYSMEALGNEQRGRSHYISPDVLDAVEGKKAIFSETFLSARDVVKFTRCDGQYEAEAKTAYVNKVFKRNQYERLFRDGWHDAFVAKRMVMLAEWFKDTKEQTANLQGAPMPVLAQQLQQMGAQIQDVDWSGVQVEQVPGPNGTVVEMLSGPLTITVPDEYVKYTLIQPERYYRDPDAAYADQGQWETVEEDIPRGVLVDLGYDPEQVEGLSVDYRFRSDEEDAARKRHDSSWTRRRQHNRIDEQEAVTFYRTWTWLMGDDENLAKLELDFEPPEGYSLYEIHWSHGEVMRWQDGTPAVKVVPESGIFEWTEMKISHAENGTCTADVVAQSQKTTSTLKRLIIDNQQIANSSRMGAMINGLKNPRDLIDNNIGAPLWMKRPDALVPLPTPQLSPLTMEVLNIMKRDSEERSGISGLAKGMNTDAVKYQNADNMIERLTTAGQRRVTAAARDFANTFLIPLAQYTAHLAMRNDTGQDQMEIGGQMVPIIPSQWQDETLAMDVAVALTPDEGDRMAQQLLMMHSIMSQDQTMAMCYGVPQKHALLDTVFELMGVSDTSSLMLSPNDPQYQMQAQQQAQMSQQQMMQQQEKEAAMLGAQIQHLAAQTENLGADNQLKLAEFDWQRTNEMADNLRADEELEHNMMIDQEKVEIDRAKASSG